MQETTIKVNDYTDNADQAWEFIKNSVIKECVIPLELDTPIHSNKVEISNIIYKPYSTIF